MGFEGAGQPAIRHQASRQEIPAAQLKAAAFSVQGGATLAANRAPVPGVSFFGRLPTTRVSTNQQATSSCMRSVYVETRYVTSSQPASQHCPRLPHLGRGHAVECHGARCIHNKHDQRSRLARQPLGPHVAFLHVHRLLCAALCGQEARQGASKEGGKEGVEKAGKLACRQQAFPNTATSQPALSAGAHRQKVQAASKTSTAVLYDLKRSQRCIPVRWRSRRDFW